MVLQSDEPFVVVSPAVVEQAESQRPLLFTEFALLEHFRPLRSPQVIFEHVLPVLPVYDRTLIYHDFCLVPFTERLGILRHSRNHVIQRSRLAVVVLAQLGIRMVGIVQYLVLRSGNVDGLHDFLAVLAGAGHFLGQVKNARVPPLGNLPFKFQLEILELVGEDKVAAVGILGFTPSGAVELDATVLNGPFSRDTVLAVTPPSIKSLPVENGDIPIRIHRKIQRVAFGGFQGRGIRNCHFITCLFSSLSFCSLFLVATAAGD